jgi:hypothetical protein
MTRGPGVDWGRDESPLSGQVALQPDPFNMPAMFSGGGLGMIRSGRMVFATRFYDGLTDVGQGWATVAPVTTKAWSGKGCLSATTGATINSYAGIDKYMNAFQATRIGLEVMFAGNSELDEVFRLKIEKMKADPNARSFGVLVRWNTASKGLDYLTGASETETQIQAFTDADFDAGPQNWHNFKLVVDLILDKYCWCILDGKYYNLSALTPCVLSGKTSPLLHFCAQIRTNVAAAKVMTLGAFVLTVDEPAGLSIV